MKRLLFVLLLCLCPSAQSVGADPSPVPFDALITADPVQGPTVYVVFYGGASVASYSEPVLALEDDATVFEMSWSCGGCTVKVVVPKKDSEDTGSWKRRIKTTVDAAKELFPPDVPSGS